MPSDLARAVRAAVQRPWTSVGLFLIVALGLAFSAAFFAIADALFWKPLPVVRPEELHVIGPPSISGRAGRAGTVTPTEYFDWRSGPELAGAFAYSLGFLDARLAAEEGLFAAEVTPNFLEVLGVAPILGRPLLPSDPATTELRTVLLGEDLWRARFGGDPAILNRQIVLADRHLIVVGVLPRRFDIPEGRNLWVPLRMEAPARPFAMRSLTLVGRLRTPYLLHRIMARRPDFVVQPLQQRLPRDGRVSVGLLLAACSLTLLLAWGHIATLQGRRAVERIHEAAVSLALGAHRWQLARLWLIEASLPIVLAAVAAAVSLAGATRLVLHLLPAEYTRGYPVAIDARVLAFLAVTTMVGLTIVTTAPMLLIRRVRLLDALHRRLGRTVLGSHQGIRQALLTSQLAIVAMLLYLTGLMLVTFWQSAALELGFDSRHLVSVRLPQAASSSQVEQQIEQLRMQLKSLPWIASVAAGQLPLERGRTITQIAVDAPATPNEGLDIVRTTVTDGYFRTIGVALVAGRDFSPQEVQDRARVAILARNLAERLGLTSAVLGRKVFVGGLPYQLIGIAENVKSDGLAYPPAAIVYTPLRPSSGTIILRTVPPVEEASTAILQVARSVVGSERSINLLSAEHLVRSEVAPYRARAILISIVASVTLTIGLIAVVAHTRDTVQRSLRDTSIRVALGASALHLSRLVIRRSLAIAAAGAALGLALGMAIAQVSATILLGLAAVDPVVAACVSMVLLISALSAAAGPARSIMTTDPAVLLRDE